MPSPPPRQSSQSIPPPPWHTRAAGLGGFVPQGRNWVPADATADQHLEAGDAIGYVVEGTPLQESLVGYEAELKHALAKRLLVADWIPSASVRKSNRPPVRKSIVIAQDRPYFVKRLRASADSD